jgi:hypothetical protein
LNETQLVNSINIKRLISDYFVENKQDKHANKIDSSIVCTGINAFTIDHNIHLKFKNKVNSYQTSTLVIYSTISNILFIDVQTSKLIHILDFSCLFNNSQNNNASSFDCNYSAQLVDFYQVEDKQINAAVLFLFQNEVKVFKCLELVRINLEFRNQNLSDVKKSSILSVIPK